MDGLEKERLFAELCAQTFLKGFVFHSPKYGSPSEMEAGDVVLWVRLNVIVFEVIARDECASGDTRRFVRRIGEKRDQLKRDFDAFLDPGINITMINEHGAAVPFDKEDVHDHIHFSGVVVVDCDAPFEKLHFKTVEKSTFLPFPVAFMSKNGFADLLNEVDTAPDLYFYLQDRWEFLKSVFSSAAGAFLNISGSLERNLISYYKMHENEFAKEYFDASKLGEYHTTYYATLGRQILVRNMENSNSFVVDSLIDWLRRHDSPEAPTLLHSAELASLTRRQRALGISEKLSDGFERFSRGNERKHFAMFNKSTGCWVLFCFQLLGTVEELCEKTTRLTRLKLFQTMQDDGFTFSVFGYGFQKSETSSRATFDHVSLVIEDAHKYEEVDKSEYEEASKLFGVGQIVPIKEFPR